MWENIGISSVCLTEDSKRSPLTIGTGTGKSPNLIHNPEDSVFPLLGSVMGGEGGMIEIVIIIIRIVDSLTTTKSSQLAPRHGEWGPDFYLK